MSYEIKKKVPMVWVKAAFGLDSEVLYYESTLENFVSKLWGDFIYFPLHKRNVPTSMIKDHWEVDSWKVITLEMRLSTLNSSQKVRVKEYIRNMKRNIWREPTNKEIDSMIEKVVWINSNKQESKTIDRSKVRDVIKQMRENKKNKWSYSLS